jgi:hypothetical protein
MLEEEKDGLERVDPVLRVIQDDLVRDEQRLVGIGRSQSVKREATGKTGHGPEERLKRLGEMMRQVVLVDLEQIRGQRSAFNLGRCKGSRRRTNLHHRREGLLSVGNRGLSTAGDDLFVVDHAEGRKKGSASGILESEADLRRGKEKNSRRDEMAQRSIIDGRIGIDGEEVLVEGRVDTDDVLDLVVHLELERVHRRVEVDLKKGAKISKRSSLS